MAHAGITTLIDGANAIAHNKVVVIDSETIITGSFKQLALGHPSEARFINNLTFHTSALSEALRRLERS